MRRMSRRGVPALICLLLFPFCALADYMDHFVIREDVGLRKAPYLGRARTVVIPVEVAGHPPLDMARIQHFFSPDDPEGFVRYFQTASLGRYQPEVVVAPVVHYAACPLPADRFPNCAVKRGDIAAFTAGMDLIRDALRRTDAAGFDFASFDVNGRRGSPDGYADGVMLLGNIPFGGIAFPIGYFNQDDNLAGGEGGPLIVDGVKVSHVAISGSANTNVMVHEFGHLLGLTDLYDESRTYDGLHFSLMGAWVNPKKLPLPDAETRYRLRWANLVQVSGTGVHRIPPVESSGQVFRLGTGSQYFLVENRGPGGNFDGEFTERGLVVYHVDRTVRLKGEEGRFAERLLNCVNCDPWHPYIRIIQADGRFDLQLGDPPNYAEDLFRDGDALGPDFSGTPMSPAWRVQSTNLYDGQPTQLGLRNVKVQADGIIEVTFDAPVTDTCSDPLCEAGEGCRPVNCGPPPAAASGCTLGDSGPVLWWALLGLLGVLRWPRGRARTTS